MQVKDVMTGTLRCAEPTTPLSDIARMMREENIGAIPVCEGERLVGILTDRDLAVRCVAEGLNPTQCRAEEFMTRDPVTVTPDASVEEAAELMARRQVRRLPVLQEGRLVGVVSLGDLAVECDDARLVATSLEGISRPIHQTEGGKPKVKAA